jgi:hypothetical protein
MYFEIFAQIFPAQYGRVHVVSCYFLCSGSVMPLPSLVSVGNFHTIRHCFPSMLKAQEFGALLRSRYARGPSVQPPAFHWLRSVVKLPASRKQPKPDGQLSLF